MSRRSLARTSAPTTTSGGQATIQFTSVTQAGPLPTPDVLAGYEAVSEGAADRIIAMAEVEQRQRHENTARTLEAAIVLARRGQIAGVVLGLAGFAAATALGVYGQPWAAAVVAAVDVGGIVATLGLRNLWQRNPQPSEPGPSGSRAPVAYGGANRQQRRESGRR